MLGEVKASGSLIGSGYVCACGAWVAGDGTTHACTGAPFPFGPGTMDQFRAAPPVISDPSLAPILERIAKALEALAAK